MPVVFYQIGRLFWEKKLANAGIGRTRKFCHKFDKNSQFEPNFATFVALSDDSVP